MLLRQFLTPIPGYSPDPDRPHGVLTISPECGATLAELQDARAVTVKAIAEALQTSGTYVTKETSGLEQRGLVLKSVNPEDRREVIVTLTPKGRTSIRRIAAVSTRT